MLNLVCENFDNVVVVYNGANAMELGFLNEHEPDQRRSVVPGYRSVRIQCSWKDPER